MISFSILSPAIVSVNAVAGLDFVFHMFFLIKYSKSLEEGSFRGRSADFLWMLLIGDFASAGTHVLTHTALPLEVGVPHILLCNFPAGGAVLTCCAPFVNIQFLGSSLTFMMVCCRLRHCSSSALMLLHNYPCCTYCQWHLFHACQSLFVDAL